LKEEEAVTIPDHHRTVLQERTQIFWGFFKIWWKISRNRQSSFGKVW